jgi:hypothetical protein
MTDSYPENFWYGKVKKLKAKGDNQAVIRECIKSLPYPAAFREIAIAIRKQIHLARKQKDDYSQQLEMLYHFAVVESFFSDIEWGKIINDKILTRVSRSFVDRVQHPYRTIGYSKLPLQKTDIKWIVDAWGEPNDHHNAAFANRELLLEANNSFNAAAKEDEIKFWGKHGFEPPLKENESKKGCIILMIFLCGVLFFVISALRLLL